MEIIKDKKNIRVLFYIHGLSGGGAERVLSILSDYFVENLHYDVTVITFDSQDKDFYTLNQKINRIQLTKKTGKNIVAKIGYRMKYLYKLYKTVNSVNPDVVLPLITLTNIEMIVISFFSKKPVIAAEHSSYYAIKSLSFRVLRLFIYRFASKVIVLTNADKQIYQKYMKNVEVIPNPITLDCDNETEKLREKTILCVGRLNKVKQFDHIITVFNNIHKKHNDWKLIIAGEGKERENLQTQIDRLKLTKVVSLVGNVENISDYYKKSGIFVLCSEYEGLPMALGEAMLCSMPVVSYDCPTGPKEMIENNVSGFLVTHNNKEELEEKIEILINDSNLRKYLGSNAKKQMQKFSIDSVGKTWEKLIESQLL